MLIFRCIFPIQEIIIQGNSYRMKQVSRQLYLQTLAKCSLSRRRRAGDQDDTDTLFISIGDLFGDLGNLFFLHRLRDKDYILRAAFLYR